MTKQKLTKWVPTTDLLFLRRLGKLGEELGELSSVTNRCIIQGIDEIDPASQKANSLRLEEEIADVIAQCACTTRDLFLDREFISKRAKEKIKQMQQWDNMFLED